MQSPATEITEPAVTRQPAAFGNHRSQPPLNGCHHPLRLLPEPLHQHDWSIPPSHRDCSGSSSNIGVCCKSLSHDKLGCATGVLTDWARGGRGHSERLRSPLVPLRDRQLPASFWQEPNVPRGYPYPCYPYDLQMLHPAMAAHLGGLGLRYGGASTALALDAYMSKFQTSGLRASSNSGTDSVVAGGSDGVGGGGGGVGEGGGGGSSNKKTSVKTQSSKEFLERLQSAQAKGYDLANSRFPITEFLFYNYGLKSYGLTSSTDIPSPFLGEFPRALCQLRPSAMDVPKGKAPRTDVGVPAASLYDGLAAAGPSASDGFLAGSAAEATHKLAVPGKPTFPTLCPYLGYSCPNLHSQTPHRFWDCVLEVPASGSLSPALLATTSLLSSSSSMAEATRSSLAVATTRDSCAGWRPVAGRTVSLHSGRYHPFANA